MMANKWHYNMANGKSGLCRAAEGNCPLQGGEAPHFQSEASLKNFIEVMERANFNNNSFNGGLSKATTSQDIKTRKFNDSGELLEALPIGSGIEVKINGKNNQPYFIYKAPDDNTITLLDGGGNEFNIPVKSINGNDTSPRLKKVLENNMVNFENFKEKFYRSHEPVGMAKLYPVGTMVNFESVNTAYKNAENISKGGVVISHDPGGKMLTIKNNNGYDERISDYHFRYAINLNVVQPSVPDADTMNFMRDYPEEAKIEITEERIKKNSSAGGKQ